MLPILQVGPLAIPLPAVLLLLRLDRNGPGRKAGSSLQSRFKPIL
jgi:hypothetical protein